MSATTNFIELTIDKSSGITFHAEPFLMLGVIITVFLLAIMQNFANPWQHVKSFEINEAEFGIGNNKIKLRPNATDRQIAYKIWVELSTRKIGLPVDLKNDVISEIYDSWYIFFSITRELIKDVPVQQFMRNDTQKIVILSIEVLNIGLRPHLTQWQARFRRWYEKQLAIDTNIEFHPQEIQKKFPQFSELQDDLLIVNKRLINYREKMYEIIKSA